ncbi:MAG: hypothetical protein ACK59C_06160 [Holosporales bacterium]
MPIPVRLQEAHLEVLVAQLMVMPLFHLPLVVQAAVVVQVDLAAVQAVAEPVVVLLSFKQLH